MVVVFLVIEAKPSFFNYFLLPLPPPPLLAVIEEKPSMAPNRVSVQGVKSLGGHFACLCRGFEFHDLKKNCYYF